MDKQLLANRSIVKADVVEMIINNLRDWAKTKIESSDRTHLHGVVLVDNCALVDGYDQHITLFDGPIVGEIDGYKGDYAKNAMKKAILSLRTGMDTEEVVKNYPTLLLEGDIIFGGGVYNANYAVGVSGSTEEDDHEVAMFIAAMIDDHYCTLIEKMRGDALAKKGPITVPVTTGGIISN